MRNTPPSAPVRVHRGGATLTLQPLTAMLDEDGVSALAKAINRHAGDSGVSAVVVDLSRVQFLPSVALGALVQFSSCCKSHGKCLKLAAPLPQVRRVFVATRLDCAFEFLDPPAPAAAGAT